MSVIQWGPLDDLCALEESMDRLLEAPLTHRWRVAALATGQPRVEIFETAHVLIVRAEVPGADPKDIDVGVTGHTLTIKGKVKEEQGDAARIYYRRELRYGSFARSLPLPAEVKGDQLKTTCKNGILEICVPIRRWPDAGLRRVDLK